MTAIIAFSKDGKVYMGGDSKASDGGYSNFTIAMKKVFKKGELLIGVAGLACPLQVIRDIYEPIEHEENWSDDQYMTRLSFDIKQFIEQYVTIQLEDSSAMVLLFGYHGSVYYMTPDHSINRIASGGFWVGSGGDVSYSSAITYMRMGMDIEDAIYSGLSVAAEINVTVGAPYYVEVL